MASHTLRIQPDPDFGRLEKVFRRQGEPDRVPFFELFSNIQPEVLDAIGLKGASALPGRPGGEDRMLQGHIDYQLNLGYDYINVRSQNFRFPQKERPKGADAYGGRAYMTGSHCTISNREEFDRYAWPVMEEIDYSPLEKAAKRLPDGMKVISNSSGILENVMWLLGYEGISFKIFDEPDLVEDMFEAVATRIISYFDTLASFDAVGALALGDDMGFRTQTMLSPELMRKYVFPWHKLLVEKVHRHSKPIVLHACGNLSEVMSDIIDCGWDAKHSFEDAIEPVWEIKRKYGDRIAILGGFDMDKICRMSEVEVRDHTRMLIDRCAKGGGWTLGTGNSVANYIPVQNFLAMLEEGYVAGRY